MIPELLTDIISRNQDLNSSLVALVQANTGLFGVSVALLSILPSLVEMATDKSSTFVHEHRLIEQLNDALDFFRVSTIVLGANAIFSSLMLIYPTLLGVLLAFLLTTVGAVLLYLGGRQIASITQETLTSHN